MDILIYTKPNCSLCDEVKVRLDNMGIEYELRDITMVDKDESSRVRNNARASGLRMMPIIYFDDRIVTPEELMTKIDI